MNPEMSRRLMKHDKVRSHGSRLATPLVCHYLNEDPTRQYSGINAVTVLKSPFYGDDQDCVRLATEDMRTSRQDGTNDVLLNMQGQRVGMLSREKVFIG